ncbi:MAG: RnfABCDGE type electron transport complex subunit G [Mariprofundaceae bacterium]
MSREQWRMVLALVVVAVAATVLLALTDQFTRGPIEQARKAALHQALMQVLPAHVNDPQQDARTIRDGDRVVTLWPARDARGRIVGWAWEQIAPDGYSGTIRILIGVRPDGRVHAIRVTEHKETAGLGDGIVRNRAWVDAFSGKGLEGTRWAVKKDGGDFDQFTGATISPRAVIKAVKKGLEFYRRHREALMRGDAQKEGRS